MIHKTKTRKFGREDLWFSLHMNDTPQKRKPDSFCFVFLQSNLPTLWQFKLLIYVTLNKISLCVQVHTSLNSSDYLFVTPVRNEGFCFSLIHVLDFECNMIFTLSSLITPIFSCNSCLFLIELFSFEK